MSRPGAAPELVGRTQLVTDVTVALADRSRFGALLLGGPGAGKSALARVVVERLRWTAPVITVTGGPSLRSIPFGALAPYLQLLSARDAGSPVAVLRAVMEYLGTASPPGGNFSGKPQHPPLLVVDDAHELDDGSSALIAQLVSARRAKVLVMCRDVPTAPAEFLTLGSDGLLTRFDLGPLDPDAVGALSRQVLGGPVLTSTVTALALATGGDPMFLRTVLERGGAEGYLESRNGVWRLTGEGRMMSPQLGDLIRARLSSRSAEEISALEVVALAEPIGLDAVSRCVDPAVLARLQAEGLITVGAPPEQAVTFASPLHGELLRARVPAARSMALRQDLLRAPGVLPAPHPDVLLASHPGGRSVEGFLRFVSWSLDCGAPPDDRTLLGAAALANALRDHDLALRTARAVVAPELRGAALTQIAEVMAARGNPAYARELVDEALTRCTDPAVARAATLLSFDLLLTAGAPAEELRAAVERWRALAADLDGDAAAVPGAAASVAVVPADASAVPGAAWPAVVDGAPGGDAARSQLDLRLLECRVRIIEGHLDGVADELDAVLADPDAPARTRVGALISLAELLGSTGRPLEGAARSAAALELIEAEGAALLGHREAAVAQHVLLLTGSARLDEARAVLASQLTPQPASARYFSGFSDVVEGAGALRAARNGRARDHLLLAVEALREKDAPKILTLLIGTCAYTCALAGDTAGAAELIREFERTAPRGSAGTRLGGRVFVTATEALLGESPGARAALVALAAEAEEGGLRDVAGTALQLALLLGDRSAAEPLLRVLEGVGGQSAEDLRAFAGASRDSDADAMIAAATRAGEHGNIAFEFAALSLSLQAMGEQRPDRRARSVQRRLVILGEQREGPVPAPLVTASPTAAAPSLTPTEQRIVTLVREGYSNREIAEAKSVSVRTVEGHLYRVFAKLGVTRREDLGET